MRGVLTGAGAPCRLEVPPGADARAVGVAAFVTGVGPLLGRWVEDGRLTADEDIRRLLALHLFHGRARAGRVEELLARAVGALEARGLRAVVLKGGHTGWTLFPEPGCRPLADLDLLAPAGSFRDAERALEDAGFVATLRQSGPQRSTWVPAEGQGEVRSLELTHRDNPLTLDLHASLARGFYGVRRVDPGDPGPGDTVAVPGLPPEARGLAPPLLVLTLALHASEALHNLQLLRLVELAWAAGAGGHGQEPWEEVASRARAAGGLRFTFPALSLTEALLPGTVPDWYLEEAREDAPSGMVRVVEGLAPGTAQRLHHATVEESLMWARGPVETLRRIAHMVLPGSAGGSWRSLVRIYLERILRLGRGRVSVSDDAERP